MSLREWPASRVLLVSFVWIIVALGLFIWRLLGVTAAQAERDTGVGAASFSLAPVVIIHLGPPLLLALLWYFLRRFAAG